MKRESIANKVLALVLSGAIVFVQSEIIYGQQEAPSTSAAEGGEPASQNTQPAPETAEQVQALVAPIALYPDALVAQILSGATFPDQIALAQNWLLQHNDLHGKGLMKEVNEQSWDAS